MLNYLTLKNAMRNIMSWTSPVLMIGIDAATWDVIDPLLAAGRLPNIARLMGEGAWGRLQSFPSYLSPALWTSITTGKLPEKHGVRDFYTATRRHIRSPTLYDILNGENGRIGLFRWYATWPPARNGGFTVPSSIARSPATYPEELQFLNELLRPAGLRSYLSGGVQLLRHRVRPSTWLRAIAELAFEVVARPEHLNWWFRRRLIEAAIYADVFTHLLRKYRPEFAAILLSHTDDLGHRYWRYREPALFDDVTPGDVQKYGQVIDRGYIEADRALGTILKAVPDDTLVVVVSDHGQQPGTAQETPYRMSQEVITRLGFGERVWMTYIGYEAFLRPRDTEEGAGVLQELSRAIEQVRTEPDDKSIFEARQADGDQLVVNVIAGEEADLDGRVSLPVGWSGQLGDLIFTDGRLSGIHSEWGILIMKGPGVRKGHRMADATILDVAPTVLALRGRPVAKDMDGRVIQDLFEEGFFERRSLRFIESYGALDSDEEEQALTDGQLEELQQRLRSLGYL